MILVALAALGGGAYRLTVAMQQRVKDYNRAARLHDIGSQVSDAEADDRGLPWEQREAAKRTRDWHAARRDVYKDAATHPWRTIPPDNPPDYTGALPDERLRAINESVNRLQRELSR